MNKIHTVFTPRGGSGKTTLISNLSSILATKYKKKILIIDSDPKGDISITFGKNPYEFENTTWDVMVKGLDPRAAIVSLRENIDLLPANDDMNFLEFDILPHLDKYTRPYHLLKDGMASIENNYDYIFIDTPPSLGFVAWNCLTYTNQVIIPFVPEIYDVQGVTRVIKAINEFKNDYNPRLSMASILGMKVETNTTLHSQMLEEARIYSRENEIHMYDSVIPKSISFAKSIAYNSTPAILNSKTNTKITEPYKKIAKQFLNTELKASL